MAGHGSRVKLTRHGADLIGLCPFHDDHEPSVVISPQKNLWHLPKSFPGGRHGDRLGLEGRRRELSLCGKFAPRLQEYFSFRAEYDSAMTTSVHGF